MPDCPSAFSIQFDQAETTNAKKMTAVLARLTHELSESLGTIESIAYYLRMILPPEDEKTHRHLERIAELVASMNGTLGDAAQYFREVPLEPQLIDLHTLITEALIDRSVSTAPVFQLSLSETPALIRVDPAQGRHLLRSMFNLFRALSGRCQQVNIRTSTEGSLVTLEFTAEKLNATREEVEAMFEPFGTSFPEGTGLALASVRRIFEASGGRISARSDNGRDLSLRGAFPRAAS